MPNAQNSIAYVTVSVAVFVTLPVGGGDMLAFFSIHLKTLRVAKKLTQDQVADYVGVSRSVISAYENDMRCPSYEVLIRLSILFGVSTDYLLGIENRRYIDITELSDQEAAAVYEMVRLFKAHHAPEIKEASVC